MQQHLHSWIRSSQTGFVRNRCILDNVFLAYESINWAIESEQDMVLILLDFEKAYDRINWKFLEETLAALGFSETWIAWVQNLYTDTAVSILVNGQAGEEFALQRSVRQGCPLVLYLFILAADVLGHMIEDSRYGVEGIRAPNNKVITSHMFADDTALFLKGTKKNLDNMMTTVEKFCLTSGAKINLHKIRAISASNRLRPWNWGEEAGLIWLQPGQVTKYLGFPMGIQLHQSQKDCRVVEKVRGKLLSWASKHLSLAGRILVNNQVLLASI